MTHLKKSPEQTNSGMDIPDAAIERIARAMLPMIQRYYESDDGKHELAAWKQKHEEEQGYDDMYLFSQNTGNNFIHSNWSTLLFQHLEYRDGKYFPKYDNKQIRPQMLLTIQILICQCAHKYISYMFASEEVKEMLSIPFHQTQSKAERIDELHETFLVNLQSKTEHQ